MQNLILHRYEKKMSGIFWERPPPQKKIEKKVKKYKKNPEKISIGDVDAADAIFFFRFLAKKIDFPGSF